MWLPSTEGVSYPPSAYNCSRSLLHKLSLGEPPYLCGHSHPHPLQLHFCAGVPLSRCSTLTVVSLSGCTMVATSTEDLPGTLPAWSAKGMIASVVRRSTRWGLLAESINNYFVGLPPLFYLFQLLIELYFFSVIIFKDFGINLSSTLCQQPLSQPPDGELGFLPVKLGEPFAQ